MDCRGLADIEAVEEVVEEVGPSFGRAALEVLPKVGIPDNYWLGEGVETTAEFGTVVEVPEDTSMVVVE